MLTRFLWGALLCLTLSVRATDLVDVFTTRDGLLNNHVTAMHQERNGYLWVGTPDGLMRFNGATFDDLDRFGEPPKGDIKAIFSTENAIYILSGNSVWRFDGDLFSVLYESNQTILSHMADSTGSIWLGYANRLERISSDGAVEGFDAEKGLPEGRVNYFFEDRSGRIWAGIRHQGLAMLDASGEWTLFTVAEGLPETMVHKMIQDRSGRIWVATIFGLAWWNNTEFVHAPFNEVLPSKIIYDLEEDQQGNLLFNMSRGGVGVWDGEQFNVITKADGLPTDAVMEIHGDLEGRLWFFTRSGIAIYKNGKLSVLDKDKGLSSNMLTSFLAARPGLIWIGSHQGLNRVEEPPLETWIEDPTRQAVFLWSSARSIITDSKKDLWFPSFKGLGHYSEGEFKLYTTDDGLPSNRVHHILETKKGVYWAGTEQGLSVLEGESWRQIPQLQGRLIFTLKEDALGRLWTLDDRQDVHVITDDSVKNLGQFELASGLYPDKQGGLWVNHSSGLNRFNADLTRQDDVRLVESGPNFGRFFDRTNWWFGGKDGYYLFDGQKMDHNEVTIEGTNYTPMNIWPGRRGEVWMLLGKSVNPFRFDQIGLMRIFGGGQSLFTEEEGLVMGTRSELMVQDGQIWLLNQRGLNWFSGDGFVHYSVADGLAGNRPRDLLRDEQGNLWVATNGGISKIHENNDLVTSLSSRDGLLADEVVEIARDPDGGLWLRTRLGLQRYWEQTEGPVIELKEITEGENSLPVLPSFKLDHDRNDLIFNVSSVHPRRGADRIQYSWELLGLDSKMAVHGGGKEPRFHFPNLGSGSYLFKVTAYNSDLFASRKPVEVRFTIKKPLYRRPWFVIMLVFDMLLLVFLIYRFRMRYGLEKARIINELQTAHEMQMGLMPTNPPKTDRLEIWGACSPAREVGGDFFDYFWLDENRGTLGFVVMDVSGKSMEAAMISVMTSGLVYGEIGGQSNPQSIMSKINYPLYKKTNKKTFTTGLFGAINLSDKKLTWSNAGHPDPFIIRNGKLLALPKPPKRDLPLGVMKRIDYSKHELQLQSGDLFLAYTDGLNEATSPDGALLGDDVLISWLETNAEKQPKELVDGLMDMAHQHTGDAPQHDDITMIAIRVK